MSNINPTTRHVFERDRILGFWMILLCVGFFSISFFLVLEGDIVIGILCMLFWGLGFLSFVGYTIGPKAALVLSPSGLTVKVGLSKVTNLSWSEIRGVHIVTIRGQRSINLLLHNPELVLSLHRNPFTRLIAQLNMKMCGSPLIISVLMVKADLNELKEALESYALAHGGQTT